MSTTVITTCDFCRQPIDGPVVRVRLDRSAANCELDAHPTAECVAGVGERVRGMCGSEKGAKGQ